MLQEWQSTRLLMSHARDVGCFWRHYAGSKLSPGHGHVKYCILTVLSVQVWGKSKFKLLIQSVGVFFFFWVGCQTIGTPPPHTVAWHWQHPRTPPGGPALTRLCWYLLCAGLRAVSSCVRGCGQSPPSPMSCVRAAVAAEVTLQCLSLQCMSCLPKRQA